HRPVFCTLHEAIVPTRFRNPRIGGSYSPALVWKGNQGARIPLVHRRSGHIHDHSQSRVIANKCRHVDHSLLSKTVYRPRVGGITHTVILSKLRTEVIRRFFVRRHSRGTAPFSYRRHELRFHSSLQSQ